MCCPILVSPTHTIGPLLLLLLLRPTSAVGFLDLVEPSNRLAVFFAAGGGATAKWPKQVES